MKKMLIMLIIICLFAGMTIFLSGCECWWNVCTDTVNQHVTKVVSQTLTSSANELFIQLTAVAK